MGHSDLNENSIYETLEGYKNEEFSPSEVLKACLNKIDKEDGQIKAYVLVDRDNAESLAKRYDQEIKNKELFNEKPLLGIPIAVKDNFCTKGVTTTASSEILKSYVPQYDATVVKKLKNAGAIIIGKTNMDAWAHGSSTETSQFFTTKNPWNTNYLPGGSSGGSAAAVSANETIAAIGSETAGSIRQPSSWCGVVGLKPTYGRVSRYGLISMASSTDSPGPITKTVIDAGLILKVIAGEDGYDATASRKYSDDYCDFRVGDVKKLRIGVSEEYFNVAQPEITKAVKDVVNEYKKLGAKIIPIALFDPKYAISVYTILQRSEVSSNLGRYDGIRFGKDRKHFGDEAIRRIMLGTYCLSAGYFDKYYLKAQKVRTLIVNDFEKAFKKVDVIIAPTSPSTALPVGSSKDHPMFGEVADVLVEPSTIAGLPGISINVGFSKAGLPIGMQIIGPQFSERNILTVANMYETLLDKGKTVRNN